MRLAFPASVRRLSLGNVEQAVRELTEILSDIRDAPAGARADLEAIATQTVETAVREGALLLAMVTPEGADPALLTGIVLEVPDSWDADSAEGLRDSMEDVGGPDVRETRTLDTSLGPAVIVQRLPTVEQARAREPLTGQLQAFIPEPGTGRMLLLTLAGPSVRGWDVHRRLFVELVGSASLSGTDQVDTGRAAGPDVEEESFEHHTYRLG